MARRSREAIQKRLRERKRAEKAAAKRQKRLERKRGLEPGEGELEAAGGIVLPGQTEATPLDDATGEATASDGTEPAEEQAPEEETVLPQLHPTTD